jgi:hypothetical protein
MVLIALLLFRLALQPRSGWKIYLMQLPRPTPSIGAGRKLPSYRLKFDQGETVFT